MTQRHRYILPIIFSVLALSTAGCLQVVDGLLNSLVQMMGATPTSNYADSGHIDFSLMPTDTSGSQLAFGQVSSVQDTGSTFQVQNDDGSYSECELVDERSRKGREITSLAILLDGSGSMERTYPAAEYGDLCPTCPHDPQRQRVTATGDLMEKVLRISADSQISLLEFGPDPDPGRIATRVLSPHSSDLASLQSAISRVDGSQLAGTPLWDALAESIIEHGEATDDYEVVLSQSGKSIPDEPVARFLLVISDGDDRDSENYTLDQVISLARENNVIVHAIGLGPASALDENDGYNDAEQISAIRNLQRLAAETDGFYGSVESPSSMNKLFADIAHSMTHGYIVTTYKCLPRENGSDPEPRNPDSGERVRGVLQTSQGQTIPWTVVTP